MIDELAGGEDGGHELHAVDHGVEPAFQQAYEVFRGVAAQPRGPGVEVTELAFGDVAVIALEFLFGAQVDAEIRELTPPRLAVLAGAIGAHVDRAFGPAPEVFAHAAVDLVLGFLAFAHECFLTISGTVAGATKQGGPLAATGPHNGRGCSPTPSACQLPERRRGRTNAETTPRSVRTSCSISPARWKRLRMLRTMVGRFSRG